MKKLNKVLSASVLVGLLSLSVVTTADAGDSTTKLHRVQSNTDSVNLYLENVNYLTVKSYQVSLKLEGNVKFKAINFANSIKSNAKASYKYDENTNVLDIYVTSKKNLLNSKNQLEIGSITVEGTKGEIYNIVPNTGKNDSIIKVVSTTNNDKTIEDIEVLGQDEFTVGEVNNSGSGGTPEEKPEKPEEPEEKPEKPEEPEEKPEEKPVLNAKQEKALKGHNTFMKVGSKYDLSSSSSIIKSEKDAAYILTSKDRKAFLAEWNKLSSKEKQNAEMKAVKNEYQKAIAYVKATNSILDYANDVSKKATSIAKDPKLAKKYLSAAKGSKRTKAVNDYRVLAAKGEYIKKSKRKAWAQAKYETTKIFLQSSVSLGEYDKEYKAAKTTAKKKEVTKKYKAQLNKNLAKMTHSPTQKAALEKEMKKRFK